MDDKPGRHVVAACGEALIKVPATDLISASYSTRVYPLVHGKFDACKTHF